MNSLKIISFAIIILWAGAPLAAAPSLRGPTGFFNVPSASALAQDQYNIFVNHHDLSNGITRLGGNIGTGLETPMEIGLVTQEPEAGASETVMNLKFRLARDDQKKPALAIGALDLTDEIDRTLYIALTKRLDVPGSKREPHMVFGTIGLGANDTGGVLDGIFFAVAYQASDTSWLLTEYDGEHINAGLHHRVSDAAIFHVGSVNDALLLGFSYNVVR